MPETQAAGALGKITDTGVVGAMLVLALLCIAYLFYELRSQAKAKDLALEKATESQLKREREILDREKQFRDEKHAQDKAHREELLRVYGEAQKEIGALQDQRVETAETLATRTFESVGKMSQAIDVVTSFAERVGRESHHEQRAEKPSAPVGRRGQKGAE